MINAWLRRGFWFLLLATACVPEVSRGIPALSITPTNGLAGTTVMVPIFFTTDTNVATVQFDLVYNPVTLTAGMPTVGPAVPNDEVGSSQVAPNTVRVGIFSFSGDLLRNGTVAFVPLTIASNDLSSVEILTLTNVMMTDQTGTNPIPQVAVLSRNLGVIIPAHFNAIGYTNGVAHLGLLGAPGSNYVIQAATNLATPQWKPLVTNAANSNGVVLYIDLSPGVTKRFYRAVKTN